MIREIIRAQALDYPDAPAILAPGRETCTYSGLDAAVLRYGAILARLGVRSTDRVVLVCSNGPAMAMAFLGIAAHAACAPLNPAYRASEFEFYLTDLRPRAVVVEAGLDSPIRALAAAAGIAVFELDSPDLAGPAVRAPQPPLVPEPGNVALLLYTSGTTARPKLVPLTQSNLCASAGHIARSLQLSASDRCLNVMPLFHIHGLAAAMLASLASGGSVVCCPGFVGPKFFKWLEEFRPTWYTAVPTILQSVTARAADHRDIVAANPLRFIRSCSSALAPSLMEEMEAVFQVPVVEAYGMTEAAHQISSNPLTPGERRPGSVGVAAGPEVAIMNEAGVLLPRGATGEIVIRGLNVTSGYAENPEANARAFSGGWFRTGDQGYLDADGYLFLNGRLKEIINRGGEKIAPREIDEVLLRHPAVAQAVAFSVPDASLGEAVAAAVVVRSGYSPSERELREYAIGRLADFKVPEKIVFLDEIPKGPTGKIQRIGLAARLGVEEIQPSSRERAGFVEPRSRKEKQIAEIFQKALGVERVGVEDSVFDLGGDSLLVAILLTRIREASRMQIPLLAFLECPTVSGVCRILASRTAGARPASDPLRVIVRPGQSEPALFCIPGSKGDITGFFHLARHLGKEQPVVAFQFPPVGNGHVSYRVEDLAARWVAEIFEIQHDGPYHLAGTCTGGVVVYEIARQLALAGKSVGLLALLDCYNHASSRAARPLDRIGYRFRLLRKRIVHQSRNLKSTGLLHAPAYLAARFAAFVATSRQRTREHAYDVIVRFGFMLPDSLNDPRLAIRHAVARYVPSSWSGSLELFRVEEPRVDSYDYPEMGWSGMAQCGIRIHDVPGSHLTMLREPVVQLIAERLQVCLRQAVASRSNGSSRTLAR